MSLRFQDLQPGRYYETVVDGKIMPFFVKNKTSSGRHKFHFQIDTLQDQWLRLKYSASARYRLSTKDRFKRIGTRNKL